MSLIPKSLVNKIKIAPQLPGVYIFKNETGEVLYIGKAINLRKRLLYYTKKEDQLYEKTAIFLRQSSRLDYIKVESDVEALLLEMNLIRTLKPKYNIISKDDKRPLYVLITNNPYPTVRTARIEIAGIGEYFGPFPSGYKLNFILKKLRKIFPYCSCTSKKKIKCNYADLKLCPGPYHLLDQHQKHDYLQNIKKLKLFLKGNILKVITILEKEMIDYAKLEKFEEAANIKEQIDAIKNLTSQRFTINQYLDHANIRNEIFQKQWEATALYFKIPKLDRIEAYDIANTGGKLPTASMAVFENAFPNTSKYRRFKIRGFADQNDPEMIYQTLKRRFKHEDWPLAEIILIDGGITQLRAAKKAAKESGKDIIIISLAKKQERLFIPLNNKEIIYPNLAMDDPILTLMRSIRDEAHRFTTNYHKKLREKSIFKI